MRLGSQTRFLEFGCPTFWKTRALQGAALSRRSTQAGQESSGRYVSDWRLTTVALSAELGGFFKQERRHTYPCWRGSMEERGGMGNVTVRHAVVTWRHSPKVEMPLWTLSTLSASDCVRQPPYSPGFAMFSRIPSVCKAWNAVRVPPRARVCPVQGLGGR